MYEFVGPREGPARQLVTNMNFHASDVCIGMATSFVTIANLTKEAEPSECEEGALFSFHIIVGYEPYTVHYNQLLFLVHNRTYLNLFNITCNRDVEVGASYNVL